MRRCSAGGLPSSVCFIVLNTIEHVLAPEDGYAATQDSSKKTMALFHGVFLRFVCFLCVTQLPKTGTRKAEHTNWSSRRSHWNPGLVCRQCVFWVQAGSLTLSGRMLLAVHQRQGLFKQTDKSMSLFIFKLKGVSAQGSGFFLCNYFSCYYISRKRHCGDILQKYVILRLL